MPSTICNIFDAIFSFVSFDRALASPVNLTFPGKTFFFPSVINSVIETIPLSAGFSFLETIDWKAIAI